ncbi:molybdopterin-dependent oxidoreductase [Novosphingobium sp. FSY-8]|uniref:Molybdopterin-dependent oxidoreductase n=1 Tax=Novosphingobium ovatum TaxID=1908523 RepID=A0ABW9XDL7_9SPHN|nr:molybdopterin cofactor-binding domain-containing protein [Novosphingobium ovatum]NBC36592.1 molybdopterin-dependent oxidoreductase [Novosphingobium ovatum]
MVLSRRQVMVVAAAGGGLLVAMPLLPTSYPDPTPIAPDERAFGVWIRIDRAGMVSVAVPQLEMGQGVSTILPQVVAMELGADWRQIAVAAAPISEVWANAALAAHWAALWMPEGATLAAAPDGLLARRWAERNRFMATADGMSLAAYEQPARAAAAVARMQLAGAAAARWGIAPEQCDVAHGRVSHQGRSFGFGELVDDAARLAPVSPPPLRPNPPQEHPLGMPPGAPLAYPRLDLPAKVDGTYPFAADIRLPGMAYAALAQAPRGIEATLSAHDDAAARRIPGVIDVVTGDDWIAAVASNSHAAQQAVQAAAARFVVVHPADSARIDAALDQGVKTGDADDVLTIGDAAGVIGAKPQLSSRYDVGAGVHAPLETASVTIRLSGSPWGGRKAELWMATQTPERARIAVAREINADVRDVVLYPLGAGGSFDARLESDHAAQAARIAAQVQRPVQLVWTRWQEQLAARPRAPAAIVAAARTDPAGRVAALALRVAAPATNREFARRFMDQVSPTDGIAVQGEREWMALEDALPPYDIGHLAISHVPVGIGLSTGRMRGQMAVATSFAVESLIDELAVASAREPLAYRMAMLGHDARLAQCLQRVSALAQWNGGRDGSGAGLACWRMGSVASGGCIAAIATARRDEQGLRVDRIAAVADIGRIVNVDIARQQIEGGLIFGIAMAAGASNRWAGGLPVARRLSQLGLPLLANCPEVEVELIASNADPFDPGELGAVVAAPAIANALFSATGVRMRRLPLAVEE